MCLPNNCNRMSYWYKEILSEFAESNIIGFIIGTVMGTGPDGQYIKYSDDLADLVKSSEYAIC